MFELRPGILGHILAPVEIDRLTPAIAPVVIIAVDLSRVYLATFLTKADDGNIGYFIHALLWNPAFLNHYWTQMEASTGG